MRSRLPVASTIAVVATLSCLAALSLAAAVPAAARTPDGIVVKDGVTQPVFPYAEAISESVFIETAVDSDADGRRDRVHAVVYAYENGVVRPST